MSHRRAIGLITSFISGRFFEQFMNGLQPVAWQHQVDILVIHGTPEQVALSQVGQQRVDGWLVLTYMQGLDILAQQGKPIVTISGRVPNQTYPAVLPDNRQGIETIVEHLIAEGHRRIAFVGDTSIGDIEERYIAYQAMLKQKGIPFDPDLVVITDNPLADRGIVAARKLLSAKVSCTAVIAGNDWTAIGLMREFQAQGHQIPHDIAVVGFDDIPEAQVTDPPLSTVRQRTDELGSTAARLLLSQMAGETIEPTAHYIPTTFVPRASSSNNLMTHVSDWEALNGSEVKSAWRAELARELVRVLLPALPLDAVPSPAQVWPEADKLVRLLEETAGESSQPKSDAQLLQAIFASPPILNANPEILVEMLAVLRLAGVAIIANDDQAGQKRQHLERLLDRILVEVMRTYRRRQNSSQRTLSEVLQSQYYISQLLLQSPPQQLDWLKETSMYSGCLGLWAPAGGDQSPGISVAGGFQKDGNSALRLGTIYPAAQFPPVDLLPSSANQNEIATCLILAVRTQDHDWGMLAVSGPLISNDPWLGDNTINTLEISCGFLGLTLERETLLESLRRSTEHEERLANEVRALTCPIIPILDGAVLLPIADVIDMDEASQIIWNAVGNETVRHSRDVLLDLTGVQLIDTEVGHLLVEVVQQIASTGARATIVGIGHDVQQQLFGTSVGRVYSQPTLTAALERLKRNRYEGEVEQPRPVAY